MFENFIYFVNFFGLVLLLFFVLASLLRLAMALNDREYKGTLNQLFVISILSVLGSGTIFEVKSELLQVILVIVTLFLVVLTHEVINKKIFN